MGHTRAHITVTVRLSAHNSGQDILDLAAASELRNRIEEITQEYQSTRA